MKPDALPSPNDLGEMVLDVLEDLGIVIDGWRAAESGVSDYAGSIGEELRRRLCGEQ